MVGESFPTVRDSPGVLVQESQDRQVEAVDQMVTVTSPDVSLIFNPRNHTYRLDGEKVPSVTGILKAGLPKPALMYWSAKSVATYVAEHLDAVNEMAKHLDTAQLVAALKQTPWSERDTAATQGTEIHALAETIVKGETVEVPDRLIAHVDGYVTLIDTLKFEPLMTEAPCARRGGTRYAGTLDTVGLIRGETWLIDWKTSTRIYGETALQVGAYASADFAIIDGVEMPIPTIDRLGVVHITPHGSYLYDLGTVERAFAAFQKVYEVAIVAEEIGTYITEPINPTEAQA